MRNSEAEAFSTGARPMLNRGNNPGEQFFKPTKGKRMASKQTQKDVFSQEDNSPIFNLIDKKVQDISWQGIGVDIANGIANALVQKLDPYSVVPILTQFFSSVNSPVTLKASAEGIRIRTHSAKVVINRPGKGYLKNNPAFHTFQRKEIDNSQKDGQDNSIDQITKSGYDEKIIDFLDHKSFVSLEDLFNFAKLNEKVNEQSKLWNDKNDILADKAANSKSKIIRQSFDNNTYAKLLNRRLLSYIRYIDTKLTIYNDAIAYISYTTVYVCIPHIYKNCDDKFSGIEISELYNKILKETQVVEIRSMKPSQILWREDCENSDYKKWPFKLTIGVEPGATLEHSQALKEHVQIVKKLKFQLRPSEKAVISVRYNFTEGLELFHANRYAHNNSPAGVFFIVETVGSPCRLTLKKDPEKKRSGGTAPIQSRYEVSNFISYLSNDGASDEPLTRLITEPSKEFEDGDLRNKFYPTRQAHKNIPRENIDVTGRNKNAEWILDIDLSQTNTPSIMETAYILTENLGLSMEKANEAIKNYSNNTSFVNNEDEEDSDILDVDAE